MIITAQAVERGFIRALFVLVCEVSMKQCQTLLGVTGSGKTFTI